MRRSPEQNFYKVIFLAIWMWVLVCHFQQLTGLKYRFLHQQLVYYLWEKIIILGGGRSSASWSISIRFTVRPSQCPADDENMDFFKAFALLYSWCFLHFILDKKGFLQVIHCFIRPICIWKLSNSSNWERTTFMTGPVRREEHGRGVQRSNYRT